MRFKTITIFAALGALAACSNGSSPPGTDAGPDGGSYASLPSPALDPVDACNQIAQALGSLEVRCNRLAAVDEANWVAAYCAGWIDTQQAEFDAGLLAYDPVAVNCEATFRQAQACNLPDNSPSGCTTLVWGKLLAGDPCGDANSCEDGDYCNRNAPGIACGTCNPDPQLGGACGPAVSNAPCVGSQCDGFNCQAISALAGDCGDQSSVCAPGLTCNASDVCQTPAVIGVTCGQDGDCLDGLYCDPNLLVCTLRPGAGDACPGGACAFGSVCVPPNVPDAGPAANDAGLLIDGGPGTCVQMTPLGPCVATYFCLEGEACNSDGGCVVQPGLGQPCTADVGCLAGGCLAGTCVSLAENQACTVDQQCQSDLCGGIAATGDVCAGACTSLTE